MPNNILNLMIKKKKTAFRCSSTYLPITSPSPISPPPPFLPLPNRQSFRTRDILYLSGSHPDGASKKRRLAVYNAQTTEFKSYCIVTSREFLEVVVVTGIMLDALTMALSHYLQNYACHTKPPQEVLDLYRKNRMQ